MSQLVVNRGSQGQNVRVIGSDEGRQLLDAA